MHMTRSALQLAGFFAIARIMSACNGSGESWVDEPAPVPVDDVTQTPEDHTDASVVDRVETAVARIDGSIDVMDVMDVSRDTFTSDAVIDTGFDVPVDSPSNDRCAAAIDVSNGGVFTGTTCGAHDDFQLACGSAGTPDVFFAYTTRAPTDMVFLTITPDTFALEFELPCGQGHNGCGTSSNSLESNGDSQMWGLGVESTVPGACGPFTLTVTAH